MGNAARAELLGVVETPAAAGLLDDQNAAAWSGGARFVGGQRDGELFVYARDRLLAGHSEPEWVAPVPGFREAHRGRDRAPRASASPDGRFAVAADASMLRALDWSGSTRWEAPHDPWPLGSPPGAPVVSPDGRHVSVVVPTLRESLPDPQAQPPVLQSGDLGPGRGRPYVADTWLLLDAGTGAVVQRRQIPSVASRTLHRWHPSRAEVAVCAWTAWSSWRTVWLPLDGGPPRDGTPVRWVAGIHPDGSPVYSVRNAEQMFDADTEESLAAYEHPGGDERARLDVADLARDEDDAFVTAALVDGGTLIAAIARDSGVPGSHWLLDAATLRPRAEIEYPLAVHAGLAALGDGTWLTTDGGRLHRWRLGRR
jgi:hypothetical protein